MKSKLAPQQIVSLSTLLVVGIFVLSSYLATSSPWLGLTLAPAEDGGLLVLAVDERGPAAGKLQPGERLLYLEGVAGALDAIDIVEEPDAFTLYRDYNAFFARQSELYRALSHAEVTLQLDDGRSVSLTPAPRRPISSLPLLFWYQLLCGAVVFLAGMSVLAFRPRELVTAYYALTGFGLLLAAASAAIYSMRELALAGDWFYQLSLLNQFGSLLFAGTFISILWYYPQRFHPFPFGPVVLGAYFVSWLLNLFQVYETLDAGMRYPLFVGLALNLSFALKQWRLSRSDPVNRAILKWFLLAWLSGTTVYLGLYTLPLIMNYGTFISQSLGWGILVTVYLGVAFGITRYRLFNLDRWVITGWFWLLGGVAVIGVDVLLLSLLHINDHLALAMALALTGWVYFPLRQYLFKRLSWKRYYSFDYGELMPGLLASLLNTRPADLQHEWSKLLQQVYSPLHIETTRSHTGAVRLKSDGVTLAIPAIYEVQGLELSYADRGSRLFNEHDLHLADAIHQLFCKIHEFRRAFASGVEVERQRVARDLHDDVGARLLTLVYSAADDRQADLARETLQELRSVIRNLEHKEHSLVAALTELRLETVRRCEVSEVALNWNQPAGLNEHPLEARTLSNLQRIVREAVSNALRHGRGKTMQIDVVLKAEQLQIQVSDDGEGTTEAAPKEGRGMRNIRSRAAEVGGSARWHFGKEAMLGGYTVEITIPLQGGGL